MVNLIEIAQNSRASQGTLELEWLLIEVDKIKPKIIVEVGVHQGYSLTTWQDAFKPDLLIGIDKEDNENLNSYLENQARNTIFIHNDSHLISTFDEVEDILDGDEIDFLFIDGDHSYIGVKQDFEIFRPLVRKGGIIAFDDIAIKDNPTVEVYKFWDEIKSNYRHSFRHLDNNGMGILHV